MNLPTNGNRNQPRPGWAKGWGARLQRFRTWLLDSGSQKETLPRVFLLFLLLFGTGMIVISLIGDQGLIAYYRLRTEAAQLRQDVKRLEKRRTFLGHEIRALRDDPRYIEHLARRDLGLVKKGEIVVQLPAKEASQ